MAEGLSYSSLEDDRDSSTTDPEHSAPNRADDDLCDTPLSRGGRSFSEHEIADESVPQKVYLDSFGDKKRPRQKDNPSVRSPPAKNPDLKKSVRRRRSSSTMEVDQSDQGMGYNPNFATGTNYATGASLASFPSQTSSSGREHVPDLILSKKSSPNKNYDPKLRPGVTSGSLGPTGMNFSPTRALDPLWNQPHSQPPNYNPNLRPGVTDLSQKFASGYNQPLSPSRRSGHSEAVSLGYNQPLSPSRRSGHSEAVSLGYNQALSPSRRSGHSDVGSLGYNQALSPSRRSGHSDAVSLEFNQALSPGRRSGLNDAVSSNLAFNFDQSQRSGHDSSPRRKMIQRQVSDDGVEADREDDFPESSCTSPNRGQKKILKMKKTLDDKLYYRSTIEPIFLETCETYRALNCDPVVDVVALLKEKTRAQLQFQGENDVKGYLMHLITHPHDWLDGIVEHKVLKSLNLVQQFVSKFILSPVKASLPSILKGNVDAQSGAIPKFQPILYSDSPLNTCDEEEQREREKARRISPRKKADAMGLPKISPEDLKNLERVADRLIQECSESRSGASGFSQVSYC